MWVILLLCFVSAEARRASPEENLDVSERASNGAILVEGDIAVQESTSRGSVNSRLWDDGVLVYEIDSSLDNPTAMGQIKLAMDDWSRTTCIKFKKRTTETAYVSFFLGGGCWSYVGKTGKKQQLSLARGCWGKGTIIHEIGHALGFLHEQSRPDRNTYVEIKFENIREGMEGNFRISSSIDSLGTPYDYRSVMHYGEKFFSKNGKPTIVPKKAGVSIGNRAGLSAIDIKQMNLLYKCQDVDGLTTPKPTTTGPTPGKKYKLIGCFKDKKGNKKAAIPFTGKRFKGPTAITQCSAIAASKGYRVFAVKRTKCHTGPRAHLTYDKYGEAPDKECKKGRGGRMRISVYSFGGTPPLPASSSPPVTQAPPKPGSCGVGPRFRIVGGVAAKHGDWPWQAMLRTSSGFPYCGGTLVDRQWVVTATHCVRGKSPSSVFVRMGAHKRRSNVGTEQDFKVTKVITHQRYNNPNRYANDIALLKLERPALLNRYVGLACLPDSVPAPTDGDKCWITGWGTLSSGGATPDDLQQASVPVVSRARCDRAYPRLIHESMVCAGLDQGGVDACQGDSGGPMVCESGGKFYLQGATSWGYGCAAPRKFGVYAKVKHLMSWINQNMAEN